MTKSGQWTVEIGSYAFVLAILYLLLTALSIFQLSRILYYRHAVLHYQFGFLLYTLLWGLIRSVFWLFLPWDGLIALILQGSALLLQFGTFTFLVLFYAQMIYKGRNIWSEMKGRSIGLYVTVNLLILAFFIATIVVAVRFGSDMPEVQMGHAFFIAAMYLLLGLLLAIFGWRLMYLVGSQNIKIPFLKSKIQISVLTVTLFLVFISRAVKDFLSALDIASWELDPLNQPITVQALLLSAYIFWEVIPAFMVILFFWHIPGRSSGIINAIPSHYGSINTPGEDSRITYRDSFLGDRPTNLFTNLHRYDSDDDELTTPISPSSASTPSGHGRRPLPRFGNYSGYNTKSPLLDRNMGSPWNESS